MRKTLELAVAAVAVSMLAGAAPELRPVAMKILPPGAVGATGWLRQQLQNQADGLTGNAETLYDDIGQSDWLTGKHRGGQHAWERGPYYAKGLLSLAYALDDPMLKLKARRWADAFIGSQRANGDFGPRDGNWWANMIVLHFLRDWAEATGDARVVPFLEHYFRYQREALKKKPLGKDSCWAACRGGDELEVVLWLYEKTGNREWLDFAGLVRGQTCDWALYYLDGRRNVFPCGGRWNAYQNHIVNLHQGLKTPALVWRLTGDDVQRKAWFNATSPEGWMMRQCGRVDGLVNGTEPITSSATAEGVELCAQAERILSGQVVLSVFGDAEVGDDMERVAYNTLPATLDPHGRGTRYYCILNQPACRANSAGTGYRFRCNGEGTCMCPGPEAGFGCCRSNFHFAWPKFVQSMWMELAEGGLAATAYGPCHVTAGGFSLIERTDYPFRTTIEIQVESAPAEASTLAFRIPKWARGADVTVNGRSVNGVIRGRFTKIRRVWKTGDRISILTPCEVELVRGAFNNSVAVRRGALLFAWPVPSQKVVLNTRFAVPGFEKYELHPIAPWNVALEIPEKGNPDVLPEIAAVMPVNPFDPSTPAMTLTLNGFRTLVEDWGTMSPGSGVRVTEPPKSPVSRGEAKAEKLVLCPLGATQTRITCFPWAPAK